MSAASRLSVLAETKEATVLRVHGRTTGDKQSRGVVIYVSASAQAATVAAQLRRAARELEKPTRTWTAG